MTNWPQSLTQAQGKPDSSMCLFQGHTYNRTVYLSAATEVSVSLIQPQLQEATIDSGVIDSQPHSTLYVLWKSYFIRGSRRGVSDGLNTKEDIKKNQLHSNYRLFKKY